MGRVQGVTAGLVYTTDEFLKFYFLGKLIHFLLIYTINSKPWIHTHIDAYKI